MVLTEFLQANILGNGGYLLSCRAKRVLVTVVIMLCLVVTACEGLNDQVDCGKRDGFLVSSRIAFGKVAQLGEFPWHAAIFSSAYNTPKNICGGSIIHESTVISSAHCFMSSKRLVHAALITVHVGLVNLNATTNDQQVLNVSKIIPHPKFLARIGVEYDIAILKLSTNIVMSPFVYPICLWDKPAEHSQLVGKTGTTVGFGMTENDTMSSILRKAELTVVDIYDCLDNDRETHGRLLTWNMYCAGGEQNVSACNGDSGGGMFFEENGIWFIRGIISFIVMRPNAALCDTSKYTIFTDVSIFSGWFKEFMIPGFIVPIAFDVMSPERPWYQTPCKGKTVPKNGICNVAHLFEHNFLLVGQENYIVRVPFNGDLKFMVSTTSMNKAIDHDCAQGRFYWISYDTKQFILSANYNGTDQKLFIEKDGMDTVEDVALDWISRRLYWIDTSKRTIEVASLENPNMRAVLIYENLIPKAIVVDPLRSKLYWTNKLNGNTIESSNLDGTERKMLVNFDELRIESIKATIATGQLCYILDNADRIECIDPSSKRIRSIAEKDAWPVILAATDELFYWTDQYSFHIEGINMDGVRQEPITMPFLHASRSTGMTAVSDKCPLIYSPCAINNGDCPGNTICLVNRSAPAGRSCIAQKKSRKVSS